MRDSVARALNDVLCCFSCPLLPVPCLSPSLPIDPALCVRVRARQAAAQAARLAAEEEARLAEEEEAALLAGGWLTWRPCRT